MPTRLLRDGILRSERVDMLSPSAELFYRRLMSVVDDYGRYEARVKLLKADCFPLKDSNTADEVLGWLLECLAAGGLIDVYEVDGKPYLQISGFGQRSRTESRFPAPPVRGISPSFVSNARSVVSEPPSFVSSPPQNAALGEVGVEDEVEVGVEDEVEVGDAPPPVADAEIANWLQSAMPTGTPLPDRDIVNKVKALVPPGFLADIQTAIQPFSSGKRRKPNTYGFWPVHLAGLSFPLKSPERRECIEKQKACESCNGSGVVGSTASTAEEVAIDLRSGFSLCGCAIGSGWKQYLDAGDPVPASR